MDGDAVRQSFAHEAFVEAKVRVIDSTSSTLNGILSLLPLIGVVLLMGFA